jgi:SAM-dependent methyltransferase
MENRSHWETVYTTKDPQSVSWFQSSPRISLELIDASGVDLSGSIIDIGGGASGLVDALVNRGQRFVAVLDIAGAGLAVAKHRLGARGADVEWIVANVTNWQPVRPFDLWHDRAVFHFLTSEADRHGYLAALDRGLVVGGTLIMATFALDGPERCSGLMVRRYDAEGLATELGPGFELIETRREAHHTPGGTVQNFTWTRFKRIAVPE